MNTPAVADTTNHPYEALSPDTILSAVESCGLRCDGGFIALNSYENRVYQVGIEDDVPVVVKFYRPHRWSDEQILEEHAFSQQLAELEIPVVAASADDKGRTLHEFNGFRFTVFRRQGGHAPDLENPENLEWLGRYLGRIHAVGISRPYQARPHLDLQQFGYKSRDFLQNSPLIVEEYRKEWLSCCNEALQMVATGFDTVGAYRSLRLHGDFHPGNILWTDSGPHLVDLDDSRMGPAVQDLWMLLSGDRSDMTVQLCDVLEGYRDFQSFDSRELALIEPLRTLRLIHYSAWLAKRWDDPAFPAAFPWFGTANYWAEQVQTLREQCLRMAEPPLQAY